jgi:PAS domain S-box-containing protein
MVVGGRKTELAKAEPGILYIEDHQYLGLLFQKVMARLGYRIDLAVSGREGLAKYQGKHYDIVVLDYHLPDMTGIDIARELLKSTPDLAVVLVTGRGDEEVASSALNIGISDYLVKDDQNIFLEKLPDVVEGLLKNQDRRRQEEEQRAALAESEARYRALVESSIQGIVVHIDYRPVFANQAFAHMYGYNTSQEICALDSLLSLFPEEEQSAWVAKEKSISGGASESYAHSHRGVRKDGTPVWLGARGKQIQWEGEPAVQIIVVDRTGSHEAQRKLEDSEARFRALANMSSDWFWECDAKFRITSIDGRENIENLREGLGDLMSAGPANGDSGEGDTSDQLRHHLLRNQPVRNLEFITRTSPSFWLSISADPLFTEDGEFLGYRGTAQNIKGRKLGEQKLRERELILKKAQEVAHIGSFYRNPKTGQTRWSDQLFRNYGLKPSDQSPRFSETVKFLHPEDQETIRIANENLTEEGQELHHQYRVVWPDGQERVLYANIIVEKDVEGEIRHLGTVQDVTDRLAVESALRNNQALLTSIQENLPAALSIKDEDGKFTYVNKNLRTRHDLPESGMIGKTIFDLFEDETALQFHDADLEVLRMGEVSNREAEISRTDGSPLHLNNIKFPVTVDGKQFVGTISLDVTRQKQAFLDLQRSEKMLQESENYLRELVQSANAPIITLNGSYGIKGWNKAAEDITGYSLKEVEGQNFVDYLETTDTRNQVQQLLTASEGYDPVRNAKVSLLTKSGKEATVYFSTTTRHNENGQIIEVVCIGQDITQLVQAQNQLSQSQKMEAVGQLTGGIAHDFNNLLQIISGATTMLAELHGADGILTRWIEQIDDAVDRGSSLTSQLLSFSRQQNLSPSVVKPSKVVSEIEVLLQRSLGEDINWNILVPGATTPVFVDDHALQNAIINLCVNARAAMPDGGELTIKVAEVEITEDEVVEGDIVKAGSFVEISVSDNGEGMSPETRENAFNPFFSTKTIGEGTGLGLSMVYGFSRQSGGLTRLESKLGVGTRVSILLPVTAKPYQEPNTTRDVAEDRVDSTAQKLGPDTISGPILVVEDNEDVRDTTCAMLEVFGYEFVEAKSANSALEILAERPDISTIFSDVVMPGGMSGFDLARELEKSGKKYKVLLTSGYPDKLSQGNTIVDHSIEMIAKPFTIEELEAALGNLVRT